MLFQINPLYTYVHAETVVCMLDESTHAKSARSFITFLQNISLVLSHVGRIKCWHFTKDALNLYVSSLPRRLSLATQQIQPPGQEPHASQSEAMGNPPASWQYKGWESPGQGVVRWVIQ